MPLEPATSAPLIPRPPPAVPLAPAVPRHELLGSTIDAFRLEQLLEAVTVAADAGAPLLVGNHNVNSLSLLQRTPELAEFFDRCDATFVDGMAVVLLARLCGVPLLPLHRLRQIDYVWDLFDLAERHGWHVVHIGSTEDVLTEASAVIAERHPDLRLTMRPGFFDMRRDSIENRRVLEQLVKERPTILLVGMGMPRQELWLVENLHDLPPCVVLTVGGLIGYIGGERPAAPRWMSRIGIEWLYRLATEPRRLWRRYLVEPLVLVPPVLRELSRRRLRPFLRPRRRR